MAGLRSYCQRRNSLLPRLLDANWPTAKDDEYAIITCGTARFAINGTNRKPDVSPPRRKYADPSRACVAGGGRVAGAAPGGGYLAAVDDGEPSGTAGRSMVDVLRRQDLEGVLATVVRYYGGVSMRRAMARCAGLGMTRPLWRWPTGPWCGCSLSRYATCLDALNAIGLIAVYETGMRATGKIICKFKREAQHPFAECNTMNLQSESIWSLT